MEAQTSPASESLAGYPSSASGGVELDRMPEGLRSGAEMDVPDALVNPVAGQTREEEARLRAVAPRAKKAPIAAIVIGLVVVVLLIVVLVTTGFFGMMS